MLMAASLGQKSKLGPALTTGNGFTVKNIVSRMRQLPAPLAMINSKVPAVVGSKIPPDVTPGPVHVPLAGVPFKTTFAASIQASRSGPAFEATGATTVIVRVSELVQPLAFVNVYVTMVEPTPAGVNIPPEVILAPDHVPPAGEPLTWIGKG